MHVGSHENFFFISYVKGCLSDKHVNAGSKFQPLGTYYLLNMYNENNMKTT